MKDKVLVTGADGFIGSHLVKALRRGGLPVREHSMMHGNIASCQLEFDDVGHVFHLAGKTFVPESWEAPRAFYEVNVLGAVNVLEFCRRHGASITLVSSYVYGQPRWLPIGEDHPLQAANPYSHSKIMAEDVARYYAAQFHVAATIVRPFNIYGPGQADHFLIPKILKQALDPDLDRITIADLRPRRDYLYVEDLVSLLQATMDCQSGSVFNAGSGRSVSVAELIDLINNSLPKKKPICSEERFRPDEVMDVVADIFHAENDLKWHPKVDLAQGLQQTIACMRWRLEQIQ
jgi:nucleoside-diphosphate-sugar epimerase